MSDSRNEYIRRIHTVQNYIEQHPEDTLPLEKLAEIAGFSPFHFHRIFQGLTSESLARYTRRQKLERCAYLLVQYHELTITDIAYRFGFSDSAVFSRAFKNHYGMSPLAYRKETSKNCKAHISSALYNGLISADTPVANIKKLPCTVELVDLPDTKAVYIRHTGSYAKLKNIYASMFAELSAYIDTQNVVLDHRTRILSLYHDHHDFTSPDQLKTSLCITIPDQPEPAAAGRVGILTIPGGRYAVGHFDQMKQQDYSRAWDYMYGIWLPDSGLQPRSAAPFELYRNGPLENPESLHDFDIWLPIEPLIC